MVLLRATAENKKKMEYTGLICPHCGAETGIDPALMNDEICSFCPECKEQIFIFDNNKEE